MSFVQTEPGTTPIVVEASFLVPPAKVFEAWTDAAQIKQWFGMVPGTIEEATIDLSLGGEWRFVEAAGDHGAIGFEGRYMEILPERRLVFTWIKFNEDANGERTVTPPSQVEITLTETARGTNMRIVHSAVDAASGGFAIGWESGITNLTTFLRG